MEILEVLCQRRHDTIDNLMFEFNVSNATMRRDIQALMLSYPIYTTQGNGGGVHVVDGYRLGRTYMTEKQTALLEKLAAGLNGEDLETLTSILKKFTEPKRGD